MTLPKNLIIFFTFTLFLLYTYYFIEDFRNFRNFVNKEYLAFKNFLFELYNASGVEKITLTEEYIRNISKRLGVDVKELVYEDGRYKLRIKNADFNKLIFFIDKLSKGGEVESARLIDNTGKGMFEAEIILRLF